MKRVLGVDLGYTIVNPKTKESYSDSFRVLKRFKETWDNVFIVSKVNEEQKVRAIKWLTESGFHTLTGIPFENIYFCQERNEKGPICKTLGVTHFIDDRAEVMFNMSPEITKFIINPHSEDEDKFNLINTTWIKDWSEIEKRWLIWNVDYID